jgi:hypothetical protein
MARERFHTTCSVEVKQYIKEAGYGNFAVGLERLVSDHKKLLKTVQIPSHGLVSDEGPAMSSSLFLKNKSKKK